MLKRYILGAFIAQFGAPNAPVVVLNAPEENHHFSSDFESFLKNLKSPKSDIMQAKYD